MVENEKLVEMVLSAQRGEEQGFADLYDTFRQDMYYFILKTVKDEDLAADLTQDTFEDILLKIHTLREPGAFVTWSRQVAYSRCTAYFRKRKELLADEDEDGYSVFDTVEEEDREFIPDAALELEELKATVYAMLDALPEDQRTAMIMRYLDEMSVSEIAEAQGTNENTVKSRLFYGRKAMCKAVEEYEKKNGIKLRCVGIVPLLLWLASQGGKTAAGAAATATTATAATATTTTATAASGIAAKLVAGGLALALAAGGITAAVLSKPGAAPEQIPEEPLVWSGFGHAETPVKNRHFQLNLTEFTEDTISGHLDVTYSYEDFYSTEFTGTGTEAEDGTVHYALECVRSPAEKPDKTATLVYDPETEQMTFDNIYYYGATMDRWPRKANTVVSENGQWSGIGSCDDCRRDDHRFVMEIGEMTDIAITGRITMYAGNAVEHSGTFTARGYWDADSTYYEALLESPWEGACGTIRTFSLTYDRESGELSFHGMWYNARLLPQSS